MSINPYPPGSIGIVRVMKDGPQSIASAGSISFLTAFFDIVTTKLENGVRGSRFPALMNELYPGESAGIGFESSKKFQQEIKDIEEKFKNLTVAELVWNPEFIGDRYEELPDDQSLDETYAKLFKSLLFSVDDMREGDRTFLTLASKYFS